MLAVSTNTGLLYQTNFAKYVSALAYPGGFKGSMCTPCTRGKNCQISQFLAIFYLILTYCTRSIPVAWNPAYACIQ